VSRTRVVSCARKIVDQLAHVSGIVEIEFYGEIGTGLGPTLEFYSLLALELQAAHLSMWRHQTIVTRAEFFPDGIVPQPPSQQNAFI
jgi:E3 ubiquitin-protein ligase TRIP12